MELPSFPSMHLFSFKNGKIVINPMILSSNPSPFLPRFRRPFSKSFLFSSNSYPKLPTIKKRMSTHIEAAATDLDPSMLHQVMHLVQSSPTTWQSALFSNISIFLVGSPVLVSGLSLPGIAAAFLLGTLTWRAFGSSGFLLVAAYFVIGTAATKVKMAQKEAQGVAEKREGRRGPGSVIGSSAAGSVCALLSIYGVGGPEFAQLWELGFVASFCTKLSDTVSSEIGKAYGNTTYLVTTFKIVPRGTEGAVSIEGTFAGVLASILLASVGFLMGEIANLVESIIGASFQEKQGFCWLNNDTVNVINISIGSTLAIIMQQLVI